MPEPTAEQLANGDAMGSAEAYQAMPKRDAEPTTTEPTRLEALQQMKDSGVVVARPLQTEQTQADLNATRATEDQPEAEHQEAA